MRTLLVAALLLTATPAFSSQTDWYEVSPGVRLRLIADDVLAADGTTALGLEIDMPPETRTYWRVPGETGIPAELSILSAPEGTTLRPQWPYPSIDRTGGYLDYVYYGHTVLPIIATTSGPGPLNLAVTLGVCDEVCVPAMARFTLPLDFAKPDLAQRLRIEQAKADVPLPWSGDPVAIGAAALTNDADGKTHLVVGLGTNDVDPMSVIADLGVAGPIFGTPQKSPDGALVTLPLRGVGGGDDLAGQTVTLTFLTSMGAYETERVIARSGPPPAQE